MRDDVLDLSAPIEQDGKLLGRLDLGVWIRGIDRDVDSVAWHGLLFGLAWVLLLGLASWWVGRRLSLRVERLAEDLSSRRLDNYEYAVENGSDEIAALARAFNQRLDRIREAREAQAEAERQREEMIQMIVHDLKGPLAAVGAGLSLLEESSAPAAGRDDLEMMRQMKQGTQRLLRMVDSILQAARLEDPRVPLRRQAVALQELVRRCLDENHPLAERLGVALSAEGLAGEPLRVQGDPDILGRVLDNFIYNALEHSRAGGEVRVSLAPQEGAALLAVQDAGPGIAAADRECIFEKFRKGAEPSRGVGLGLAFCKLAVERHGGRIGVTSPAAGGATFYIVLPRLVESTQRAPITGLTL